MKHTRIIVVGGGVIGQVIAKKLRSIGREVVVIDSGESMAASKASGGHLKKSWLTHLSSVEIDEAFDTLTELYGPLDDLTCQGDRSDLQLQRLDMASVLIPPDLKAKVKSISPTGKVTYITNESHALETVQGTVIVAAGYWSAELFPELASEMTGRMGMSFKFTGVKQMPPNLVKTWAPYKQVVRTSDGPNRVWLGEGSAIVAKNWNQQREDIIQARLNPYRDFKYKDVTVHRGIRPYMKHGFRQMSPKVWLVTGSGKSGTCEAAFYANQLVRRLS